MRGLGFLALVLLAAAAPAAAAPPTVLFRSSIGGPVGLPAGACAGATEGVKSEGSPLVGATPEDPSELRAVYQAHGERLHLRAASHDGGRTWSRAPIAAATQCLGGPSDRNLSVNPLFDVGTGGRSWLGASWFNDPAEDFEMWSYGVDLHDSEGGVSVPPPPDESSQNLAPAAGPDGVAVLWTHIDQIPNPFTYAPTGSEIRFAQRDGSGWRPGPVVHRSTPDVLDVNARLVRSGAGFVAMWDQGALKDLPTAQLGLTQTQLPLLTSWSANGERWSPPLHIGTANTLMPTDPEGASDARVLSVKPDLAAGPGGHVVAAWAEAARNTVRIARSADGGRTWSPPEDTVSLPGPGIQPAVAYDGKGRLGIFFYDASSDTVRDGRWMIRPRFAYETASGWSHLALDAPFDARAAERCTRTLGLEPTKTCESHASALGVQQDLEGLPNGFGASYTVGPPLAQSGATDARYARIKMR